MRAHEIENWVLRIIEQVESGQPNEDYRVELKAKWLDAKKAARRIAGHANAAHGEPILWLIGVDEEEGVVGANNEELANWSAQVRAEFDRSRTVCCEESRIRATPRRASSVRGSVARSQVDKECVTV